MPPFQQYSRINVHDLKAQMVKRVGPERASQYFNHFKGYISLRFNKTELDKLVVLTIGKENIGLHNEIIKAVLSNAIKSETPPQFSPVQDTSKPVKGVCRKPSLQFATSHDASRATKSPTFVWENGSICADSARKGGLGAFDQITSADKGNMSGRYTEGKNSLVDLQRPFERIKGAAAQSEVDPSDRPVQLGKRARIIVPLSSPDANMRKVRVEQLSPSRMAALNHEEAHCQQWENGFVKAPFGTSCYANNIGSATKLPFIRLTGQLLPAEEEFVYSNDLPSAELLQRHMEYIATLEGLEGVNGDCVEIVNQGIDSFLKRLIGACIDLVKSRSGMQPGKQADRQADSSSANLSSLKRVKQLSGPEPYGSGTRKEPMQNEESLFQPTISFYDFKVAMDLNPPQLGQDWPLQLEKIHLYSFDN